MNKLIPACFVFILSRLSLEGEDCPSHCCFSTHIYTLCKDHLIQIIPNIIPQHLIEGFPVKLETIWSFKFDLKSFYSNLKFWDLFRDLSKSLKKSLRRPKTLRLLYSNFNLNKIKF